LDKFRDGKSKTEGGNESETSALRAERDGLAVEKNRLIAELKELKTERDGLAVELATQKVHLGEQLLQQLTDEGQKTEPVNEEPEESKELRELEELIRKADKEPDKSEMMKKFKEMFRGAAEKPEVGPAAQEVEEPEESEIKLPKELTGVLSEKPSAEAKSSSLSGGNRLGEDTETRVKRIKQGWEDISDKMLFGMSPGIAYGKALYIENYTKEDIETFCRKTKEFYDTEDMGFKQIVHYIAGLIDNISSKGEVFSIDQQALENAGIDLNELFKSVQKAKIVIKGDYTLTELISDEGELCDVYKAADHAGEPCAVKILKSKWRKYVTDSFLELAERLKKLHNQNTAEYLDCGKDKETGAYLAMELFGEQYVTLDSKEISLSPLSLLESVNIIKQLASALVGAHKKRVYHGCIKPSDVFYDRETGTVKLADFGLSDVLIQALEGENMDGSFCGIISVPGSIRRHKAPDTSNKAKADTYSLGLLFYDLLTGKERSSIFARPHPELLDAPKEIVDLVERMLCDVKKRYTPRTVYKKLDRFDKNRG
jgi:serine/threonine-protein kinase